MYRTPMRRGLSPDSPVLYRDSPLSREGRSWSRGRSPPRQHRSPGRRSRSPERRVRSPERRVRSPERRVRSPERRVRSPERRVRSPERRVRSPERRVRSPERRVRSPERRGRSPERRGRSPDRQGRYRSRSRPAVHTRSKSQGRPGRSRSRPRRSPAPSSRPRRSPSPYSQYPVRRRSPGDSYRTEGRSGEQHRLSPGYRSSPASEQRPISHDRSDSIKTFGHESSSRGYQSSGDPHTALPPMPKKSILKKRTDVEPPSCDQSSQVDNFSSNRDVSSAGAGKSAETTDLSTDSPLPMALKMGLLKCSAPGSSAPAQPQSPLLQSGPQPSWTLSGSTEMKGSGMGEAPLCEQTDSPKGSQYSTIGNLLFNKSTPESQTVQFSSISVFPEHKEGVQKGADQGGSSLLPHEQDCKSSPHPNNTPDPKQRSSNEIEDEERFLYGDEEDKKPEPQKVAATPPAKSSPSKQEFEKIHDLLKTIGLDIGVAEIGKLAVRTQERLHGKKVAPKMSQPIAEQPPSPTVSPADPNAKMSEPQVKMEKKDKEEAEHKTEPPVKPALKEPTPPVTQQSPAPTLKDKPKLILRKSLPKETAAAPKVEIPVQPPASSPVPDPTPPPLPPSQIPVYPAYSVVPGYSMPPPNYNPYAPYVSYPTSSWSMYSPLPPQPSPSHVQTPPAPHMSVPVSTPTPVYNTRSNLRVIETTDNLSDAKADAKPTTPIAALLAKQEADRKNKETEKLKVLEELDSVRKEHKVKSESLKTLSAKVDQLRVQQGILLRKKRRERDGHKDPLLEELNNVLESAQKQINSLCEEITTTKQKQQQLTKVAEILGVSPADLAEKSDPKKEERSSSSPAPTRDSNNESRTNSDSSKSASDSKTSTDPAAKIDVKTKNGSKSGADTVSFAAAHLPNITKSEDVKCEGPAPLLTPDSKNSPEPRSPYSSKSEDMLKSRDKSRSKSPRPCPPSSKEPPKPEEPPPFDISQIFEYYDSGSHWCEDCNAICMTLPEYLLHLHDKKHTQSVKEVKRPWVKKKVQKVGATKKQKVNIPLKGPEFLLPVAGYYCDLCEELFPDHTAAEEHIRAYAHNDKYKKYIEAHNNYEAVRREKKKARLTAAQEAARRQAEQKRKIFEQKHEAHEHSKSKKAKKEEQEEEKKAKTKRHTSASPPSSQRQKKTPEKEPAKNPTFGKFAWKASENKTQAAVSSSRGDAASNNHKEEEPKAPSLKPKGFEIKLLGKPSTLPGNALSPSHSVASTTVSSTSCTTSCTSAASSTTTSRPQTKVRPNLPSLMNIRLAAPVVTMSKPAPLNTFLSIRSPNAASKSIPIVQNKPTGVFSEYLVSKAFGGEVVILKGSTQPDPKDKAANKGHEKAAGQSPKVLQTTKGQDLFNVLISKKETVENQEVRSEKESLVSTQPLFTFPQKPALLLSTSTSHTTYGGASKAAESPGAAAAQQTQDTKSPVPNPASSPVSGTTSINSSTTNTSSTNAKSDSPINPSNQQTSKAGLTPQRDESRDQPSQKAKAPSKLEQKTPQDVKASTFSMNPVTGRFEYLPVQKNKVKDTNVQKSPETQHIPTSVTYVSSLKTNKPASAPPVPTLMTRPTFNATTRLNQKFKRAPLSLPSSLFGHVQDAGYKDIKITSESQRSSNQADKPQTPLPSPAQNKVSSSPSAKPSPANSSTMQQELDFYYKMIASEEDPEELTTSEDQDSETAPLPANVTRAPLQAKIESPAQKKVKLERALPPVKRPLRPVLPDISGEDVDDSDMACEVPEASLSSVSQTSGWKFMQSSYASSQNHRSSNQQPSSWAFGNASMNKDQSRETQVTTGATTETSMEDLSVCVTCDSD